MKKIFLLAFILNSSVLLFGQETQKVIIEIYPSYSFLKIDNAVINLKEKTDPFVLELEERDYPIEIWASKYEIFRDTITIDGKTKKYAKGLIHQSPSFKEYKKATKEYKTKKYVRAGYAASIILANVGGLWYSIGGSAKKKLDDLQNEAQDLEAKHLNLATETTLVDNRIRYEQIQSDFENKKKNLNLRRTVGIPLFCLTSVFSGIYLKKLAKKKKDAPVFKEEKNPFVLKNIDLNTFDASCQLNLKFEF